MKGIELGYGAGAIADYPWHLDGTRPWTEDDSYRARQCLASLKDLGIYWIDSAWRYGGGTAERIVGEAFSAETGKLPYLIAKVEMGTVEEMDQRLHETRERVFPLGADAILLNDPDLSKPEELERACRWLTKQRIPWYGISTEPSDEARRACDLYDLTAIEFPASTWDWRAERIMAGWMRERRNLLRIANRTLGGPKRPKEPGDVERAMEYILENRDWIDVALVGTTNVEHLKQCAEVFNRIKKEIDEQGKSGSNFDDKS